MNTDRTRTRVGIAAIDTSLSSIFRAVICVYLCSSVVPAFAAPSAPASQTIADADGKSLGCMTCHTATDRHTMHQNPGVILGCTDCHGGDAAVTRAEATKREDPAYVALMRRAHVLPR